MKKEKEDSVKIRVKIAVNISRLRFNWWRYQPVKTRHFSVVFCLCEMCHQNRKSPPGLTPSDFDGWCDECYVDLLLWLKYEKTTAEELVRLAKHKKDEAEKRRLERDERAKIQDAKKKKKIKLTGFENVENEEKTGEKEEVEAKAVGEAGIEEQRQQLELIFNYSDND